MESQNEELCKLCGKLHHHMSTPAQWRNKKAQELAITVDVTNDQRVCQPCRQDISKLLSPSSYTPRWEKTSDPKKCLVIGCVNKPPLIANKTLHTAAKTVLEGNKLKLIEPIPQSIALCKERYNMVYKLAFPTWTNCVTCGMSPKILTPKPAHHQRLWKNTWKLVQGLKAILEKMIRCATPVIEHILSLLLICQ